MVLRAAAAGRHTLHHVLPVVHRHPTCPRPQLVNNRGELKIADFGLARYTGGAGGDGGGDSRMTTRVITLWYR